MSNSVDLNEVEKFSRMADEWWDENGKFKPLHKFNPIRISYIKRKIIEHFKLDAKSLTPFKKLNIIDVGCGGGLISEPFSRLGANVTGIDASCKNIEIAKNHAQKSKLKINYITASSEELVKKHKENFDVVFALEIIEHVGDVDSFIKSCSNLLKPNGIIFIATLNRTVKSLITAKFGAEYILRWLPIGTHDWKKFMKPSEIVSPCEKNNLHLKELNGFDYNIFKDSWKETPNNLEVNYIAVFGKK
jgi:2-polyprenyl-6-hydroxyphenyl methylase/3-demethylubiquinone-9 3-methyltransferase